MKKYIAYGSSINGEFMKKMGHHGKCLTIGSINNSRIRFRGNGYLNLEVEVGNDKVPVVLWEIDEEVERKLDEYEEYPELYSKENINVETDLGTIEAFVYLMNEPDSLEPAMPEEWYVDVVKKGYEMRAFDKKALDEALEEIGFDKKFKNIN